MCAFFPSFAHVLHLGHLHFDVHIEIKSGYLAEKKGREIERVCVEKRSEKNSITKIKSKLLAKRIYLCRKNTQQKKFLFFSVVSLTQYRTYTFRHAYTHTAGSNSWQFCVQNVISIKMERFGIHQRTNQPTRCNDFIDRECSHKFLLKALIFLQ